MSRLRSDDEGFTLLELVVAIAIMGIITVPLANFVLAYFDNYTNTSNRLSDSHDIQIATAYFSQDVANSGLYSSTSPYGALQSVWASTLPASYCGQAYGGTTKLVLGWYTHGAAVAGGPTPTASAAYVVKAGALHRLYCEGSVTPIYDATVVHGLTSANVKCYSAANVQTSCDSANSPPKIELILGISTGSRDSAAPAQPVTLDGQRRQS
jgi:prepilin-type N-terminal cleavage/methylation domain-containing protein